MEEQRQALEEAEAKEQRFIESLREVRERIQRFNEHLRRAQELVAVANGEVVRFSRFATPPNGGVTANIIEVLRQLAPDPSKAVGSKAIWTHFWERGFNCRGESPRNTFSAHLSNMVKAGLVIRVSESPHTYALPPETTAAVASDEATADEPDEPEIPGMGTSREDQTAMLLS